MRAKWKKKAILKKLRTKSEFGLVDNPERASF